MESGIFDGEATLLGLALEQEAFEVAEWLVQEAHNHQAGWFFTRALVPALADMPTAREAAPYPLPNGAGRPFLQRASLLHRYDPDHDEEYRWPYVEVGWAVLQSQCLSSQWHASLMLPCLNHNLPLADWQ
jgi:hypothetical protein